MVRRSSQARFIISGVCFSCSILTFLLLFILDLGIWRVVVDTESLETFQVQQDNVQKTEDKLWTNSTTKSSKSLGVSLSRSQSSHPSTRTYLLTIDFLGRMGNNMFQYAGLLGISKTNNRTPFVLPKSTLTATFRVTQIKSVPHPEKWRPLIHESHFAKYDKKLNYLPPGNLMIQAYLQSYKYFENVQDLVRSEFKFLPHISKRAESILWALSTLDHNNNHKKGAENLTLIGVHVRRGDKLLSQEIKDGNRTPPGSYFERAFDLMRKKYRNVRFLVASDDPQWVRTRLTAEDVHLLPYDMADVHLCVLTKCDHHIMSVGTFGWWAGFLAGGDVIYYNQSLKANSWKFEAFDRGDHFPKHWIPLV